MKTTFDGVSITIVLTNEKLHLMNWKNLSGVPGYGRRILWEFLTEIKWQMNFPSTTEIILDASDSIPNSTLRQEIDQMSALQLRECLCNDGSDDSDDSADSADSNDLRVLRDLVFMRKSVEKLAHYYETLGFIPLNTGSNYHIPMRGYLDDVLAKLEVNCR